MSDTTFRLARLGEDAAIIDFINANFDMRLPLLNRPELYHHYYAGRGGVPQFAVAEQDGEYVSAAGYILANTKRRPDIWVSVWVAAKSHNGVGLELMNALPGLLNADVVACNNIRPNTCTFYQFLGWKAERLPHYYRLGRRRAYYLAKPLRYSLPPVQRDLGLAKIESAADLIPLGMPATPHTPRKDVWYMRRRYFHYPHFKYDVWAAQENGKLLAYVVTRTVTAQETGCAAVVRLVDFIGEDSVLPRIGAALDAILNHAGAEYMDCYNAGIPADVWLAAGFTERRGRRLHHPELPDPARAREHRVLLLHEQARELRLVQGRRRSGQTESEIIAKKPAVAMNSGLFSISGVVLTGRSVPFCPSDHGSSGRPAWGCAHG